MRGAKEDKLGLEAYITTHGGLRYSRLTVALGWVDLRWVDSRCIVSSVSRRNVKRRMGRKLRNPGRAVRVRRHFQNH